MQGTTFWNRIATKYAKQPVANLPAYEATLDRVRSYLTPQDKVLEVGCGTGSTALLLVQGVAGYTACDSASAMVDIARAKLGAEPQDNLDFVVAPVVDDVFEAGAFDAVLGFSILHLVPDLPRAVARAHEVLKPGGLFISKTPCLGQMGWYLRPLVAVMRAFGKAPAVTFFKAAELETAIRDGGFEIVEARAFEGAKTAWFVVARKL